MRVQGQAGALSSVQLAGLGRVGALVLAVLLGGVALGSSPAGAATPGWRPPLAGPITVGHPFQAPAQRYGPGHRGADLIGSVGAVVLAPAEGVVRFSGVVAGRGVVSIEHGGRITTYEPVSGSPPAGTTVLRGQPIGRLDGGHPGCPAPACLHWGLIVAGNYLDPLTLLQRGPSRLLPLATGPAVRRAASPARAPGGAVNMAPAANPAQPAVRPSPAGPRVVAARQSGASGGPRAAAAAGLGAVTIVGLGGAMARRRWAFYG